MQLQLFRLAVPIRRWGGILWRHTHRLALWCHFRLPPPAPLTLSLCRAPSWGLPSSSLPRPPRLLRAAGARWASSARPACAARSGVTGEFSAARAPLSPGGPALLPTPLIHRSGNTSDYCAPAVCNPSFGSCATAAAPTFSIPGGAFFDSTCDLQLTISSSTPGVSAEGVARRRVVLPIEWRSFTPSFARSPLHPGFPLRHIFLQPGCFLQGRSVGRGRARHLRPLDHVQGPRPRRWRRHLGARGPRRHGEQLGRERGLLLL